jgi:hypothetical protein
MNLEAAVAALDMIPPVEGSYWGDAIIACREAARSRIMDAEQTIYYKNHLVYVIDTDGVHHVVDKFWTNYLIMREQTPHKVVIYGTLRELKDAMQVKGVNV